MNTNHIYSEPKPDTTNFSATESLCPSFLTEKHSACVQPIIMVEKIILPLIQTMVQRLCLDHFSRHLGLTERAEQRWLYLQRPDSEEQLKKNHPGTATVFITFLCLITAQFLLEIQLQLSSTWAGF